MKSIIGMITFMGGAWLMIEYSSTETVLIIMAGILGQFIGIVHEHIQGVNKALEIQAAMLFDEDYKGNLDK